MRKTKVVEQDLTPYTPRGRREGKLFDIGPRAGSKTFVRDSSRHDQLHDSHRSPFPHRHSRVERHVKGSNPDIDRANSDYAESD